MLRRVRNLIHRIALGFERAIRQPRDELDRWGRSVRFAYDLSRVGALQLRRDRAPEMAAALAFRTLFALAPVLVVVTILVRALAGVDEFLRLIGPLLDAAGLGDVQIVLPAATGDAAGTVQTESLKQWLGRIIEQTTQMSWPALGWVGFTMIVYAAISLLGTIERTFNVIYRAPSGRPWTRSVPLYWFLLTVSPLAISLASWLYGQFTSWGHYLAWGPWATSWLGFAWNLGVTWLLLTLVFMLVPNTAVAARPAMAGALMTVILLELGKHTIGKYLASSFGVSQLVTSLGLIPLFMFWVYLMWLAVLFGLEVSAILQQLGDRNLEEMERGAESVGIADPAIVVTLMQWIATEFRAGRGVSAMRLAQEAQLTQRQVEMVLARLLDARLVHRLEGTDAEVCLARPPEEIAAAELLEIGFALSDAGQDRGPSTVIQRLRTAQRALAADWNLASLLASS